MADPLLRVALLLGGPSDERAISLNSARSVADHLEGDGIEIDPVIYFDRRRAPYRIDRRMLYSNTPDDFDFKLSRSATPLDDADLAAALRACDIAFPVMHGTFGEDGAVQSLLEGVGVPYVGSDPAACRVAYDKYLAHVALRDAGVATVPSLLYSSDAPAGDRTAEDKAAVRESPLVVIKPAAGGSSLGVTVVAGEAADPAGLLRAVAAACERHGRVVVQPFVRGIEFTTIVVDAPGGPAALLPVEIELREKGPGAIFSYRHKYLATDDTRYHCPPRQGDEVVRAVRQVAERVFTVLGLRDFARIDCWLDERGRIVVSDVNPISGLEQNSFLFIQAAELGMTHADALRLLLRAACRRHGISTPATAWRHGDSTPDRLRVPVLFGGRTAERQVSLLSGTNVWLKLARSRRIEPVPYLLEDDDTVWRLPYALALRHSVEQIVEGCRAPATDAERRDRLAAEVVQALALEPWQRRAATAPPLRLDLAGAVQGAPFTFLALHGGAGEDGTLQSRLDELDVAYNGSGPEASRLCMDKEATGRRLAGHDDEGIHVARKVRLGVAEAASRDSEALWSSLQEALDAGTGAAWVMVKPLADGCSTGVVPLTSARELRDYVTAVAANAPRLDLGRFTALDDEQVVELPTAPRDLLFEEFVVTDDVAVVDAGGPGGEPARLRWAEDRDTGWIEVTVGVLGPRGAMTAFAPSLTVARKGVLSLEEKFMGGTGVNITPPPGPPDGRVLPAAVERTRTLISQVAGLLGLSGYARIDAFMHRETGDVVVIEANTLPGLTPSTVLFHQALDAPAPMYPRDLLERIVDLALAERSPEPVR